MRLQTLFVAAHLILLPLVWGCDLGSSPRPDPQFVKIHIRYGFGNSVNTFSGTLTKNLGLDGSVTIPFWLTTAEQDTLLSAVEVADFFTMPDTVFSIPGIAVNPNSRHAAVDRSQRVLCGG